MSELLGHNDVPTTMIYTYVLNRHSHDGSKQVNGLWECWGQGVWTIDATPHERRFMEAGRSETKGAGCDSIGRLLLLSRDPDVS
jgi:hypothetical protein